MKELVNKLLANVHIFILLWGIYEVYERWDLHSQSLLDLEGQIPPIEVQIQEAKKKVKEIQDFLKKAEEYKARVEEVAKSIEAVQKQLPAETNDSVILGYFQKEMSLLNIKDPQLTPSSEEKSTYFITKNYNIKARGTFLQFLIFFERIGNAARIYNIRDLTLSNNGVPQKGRFQVISVDASIQAYRFNPDFKIDRQPETTPAPATPAPGQ